jgi:hypothetical protein
MSKDNSIVRKYRNVGQKVPSKATIRRLVKANPLVRRSKPCHQTAEEKADASWLCPTCRKTLGQLKALGKIINVQGYDQCADCHADICSAGEAFGRQTRKKDVDLAVRLYRGRSVG